MHDRQFRHRVSQSFASLPIVATLTALVWVFPDVGNLRLWAGLVAVAVMTAIVVEWNNQYQLLRIRSRMNSVTFLTLMAVYPALHPLSWELVGVATLLVSYFLLFRTYGVYRPQGIVFHAFLSLGLGSLVYPPLLFFLPTLWASMHVQLRVLSGRNFVASLLGLLLPYWLAVPILALAGQGLAHQWWRWSSCFSPTWPLDFSNLPLSVWMGVGMPALIALIAITHFVRTSYNDKIRTRQYYYFLFVQCLPLVFLFVLRPQDHAMLLPILLLHATPFTAHYFALARGRWMNVWFMVWIVLFLALGVANHFRLWGLVGEIL